MSTAPIFAKFLNQNGYEHERAKAADVFDPEKSYEIVGGSLGGSCSYYVFKGVPGTWNTVMFDVPWEKATYLLDHDY